jgi:hypothetical protein
MKHCKEARLAKSAGLDICQVKDQLQCNGRCRDSTTNLEAKELPLKVSKE